MCFGRGSVDLVGEDEVGEDGAGVEDEFAGAGFAVLKDVAAEDVHGHEVGGELDASETKAEDLTEGADEQGFGEAGDADDKAMAATEEMFITTPEFRSRM